MRRAITLSAVLAGCASPSADEPETVYDPCSPLTLSVLPSTSEAERRGVEDAIAAWDARLPIRMVIGEGPQAPDVLPVRFTSQSALRAAYWDKVGMITIHRDLLAPEDYGLALAHELGHAFGLMHVEGNERSSVMNVGNLEIAPTDMDAEELIARWESCSPVVDTAPAPSARR